MTARLDIARDLVRRLEPRMDLAATVAACAVVPVILIEEMAADTPWFAVATAANWLIWLAFVGDAAVKLGAFGPSWLRRRGAWFDIGLVVLTYPLLGELLASGRLLRLLRAGRTSRLARLSRLGRTSRLLRVLRLTRILALTARAWTGLRRVLDPDAFPFVAMVVLLVVAVGGAAAYVVEFEGAGSTIPDALWWAVTTVTTVGYGDVVPKTTAGRATAVVVMVVGIAFTSLMTAQIAAYLSRKSQRRMEDGLAAQIRDLSRKVDRLTERLSEEGELTDRSPPLG